MTRLKEHDYPCSYVDSNLASLKAQKVQKVLTWATLIIMFISTLMQCIDKDVTKTIPYYEKISGGVLLLSLVCTIVLMLLKPEKHWYIGRAVAESIKTLSWRFMMKSEPFEISNAATDSNFIDRCSEITKAAMENDGFVPNASCTHTEIITGTMRQIRSLGFLDRKQFYAESRIGDQVEWYNKKSILNRDKGIIYSIVVALCQLLAAIYLLFFIDQFDRINFNDILVFVATCAISIMEMNKYKELSQSYAFTAFELKTIRNKFGTITTEDELDKFVEEAEQAVSREHTMWLARRGHLKFSQIRP